MNAVAEPTHTVQRDENETAVLEEIFDHAAWAPPTLPNSASGRATSPAP